MGVTPPVHQGCRPCWDSPGDTADLIPTAQLCTLAGLSEPSEDEPRSAQGARRSCASERLGSSGCRVVRQGEAAGCRGSDQQHSLGSRVAAQESEGVGKT